MKIKNLKHATLCRKYVILSDGYLCVPQGMWHRNGSSHGRFVENWLESDERWAWNYFCETAQLEIC